MALPNTHHDFVELPDGTLVTTTYGHWTADEAPWIACVRLRLDELDGRGADAAQFRTRPADDLV